MYLTDKKYYTLLGLKLTFLVLFFLLSLQLLILSCKTLNTHIIGQIIVATSNPFVALFIGILVTALIQSSSTVTAMIVAVVASEILPLQQAVFLVMGANIGTTLTSTLVSLGHITSKKEFRKAMAAATAHDVFNILTAFLLFPAEYYFSLLSGLAIYITQFLVKYHTLGLEYVFNPFVMLWDSGAKFIFYLLGSQAYISFFVALLMLFFVVRGMAFLAKDALVSQSPNILEKYLFATPLQSLFSGIFITALLHSSSLVTSLAVPIVAHNKASVKKIFPFLMGANIGTTITALMASIGQNQTALSIALTHVLFNVIGVLIFFPIPFLRLFPVNIARKLGKISTKNRWIGLAYITTVFFLLPFLLIYFSKNNIKIQHYTYHFPKEILEKNTTNKNIEHTTTLLVNKIDAQKEVIFYKQTNLKQSLFAKEDIFVRYAGDSTAKIMFLNDIPFPLQTQKLEAKDSYGNFEVFLHQEIKNYALHHYPKNTNSKNTSQKNTHCKVFVKKYLIPKENLPKPTAKNYLLLSAEHWFFIDEENGFLLKYEMHHQKRVLGKEEMIFWEK